MKDSVKETT